jgi:hypothetical protein
MPDEEYQTNEMLINERNHKGNDFEVPFLIEEHDSKIATML